MKDNEIIKALSEAGGRLWDFFNIKETPKFLTENYCSCPFQK